MEHDRILQIFLRGQIICKYPTQFSIPRESIYDHFPSIYSMLRIRWKRRRELTSLAFSSSLRFLSSSLCFIFSSFFRALQHFHENPIRHNQTRCPYEDPQKSRVKGTQTKKKTYFLLWVPAPSQAPASAVDESIDNWEIAFVVWSAEASIEISFLVQQSRRRNKQTKTIFPQWKSIASSFYELKSKVYGEIRNIQQLNRREKNPTGGVEEEDGEEDEEKTMSLL